MSVNKTKVPVFVDLLFLMSETDNKKMINIKKVKQGKGTRVRWGWSGGYFRQIWPEKVSLRKLLLNKGE